MTELSAARAAVEEDAAVPGMSVTLACSFPELAPVQDEWDKFVEDSGSDIYFTMDWLQVWWHHYGSKRELRCFVLREGRRMVAALPFCIFNLRIGPMTVRLARWVGADSTICVLHPAITPGFEGAATDAICRRLLGEDRCAAVSLSPLSGISPVGDTVAELARGVSPYHLVRNDSNRPHVVFSLPARFQDYLKQLSSQNRSNFCKDERRLSKRHALRHEAVPVAHMAAAYDDFVSLHEAQWRAAGRLGHFGEWPGGLAFNRDLVERLARRERVRFYRLLGDGDVIAMQFGFVLADRYYARLPARRTDAESDKAGIGRVALVRNIEAMIGEGIRIVEDGPGRYDYKVRYGGKEYPLRRQVLVGREFSARLRTRLLLLWSDAIDLAYYRVWYLRVMPFLRIARPLSQLWIRSRL